MENYNPAIDEYIAKSPAFAKPILAHWRKTIHKTCSTVIEAIKWGIPHFDYKGEVMCIFAAHKKHCSFSFWKAVLMKDTRLQENHKLKAIDRFMGKVTALKDMPPDAVLIRFIKEAMALNEKGVKMVKPAAPPPKEISMPDYFADALAKNKPAKTIFDGKSASFRKDYLIWITAAKTEATRQKRIEQSLEWIAAGKSRFWQYEK